MAKNSIGPDLEKYYSKARALLSLKLPDHRDYKRARKILLDQVDKLKEVYAHTGDDELIAQSEVLKSEALQMEDELYSKAYRKSAKQASYDLRKKR